MQGLIIWQKTEGGLILLSSVLLAVSIADGMPWWAMVLVFFAPDLSMITYIAGPRVGAVGYNLLHSYAAGIGIAAIGMMLHRDDVLRIGLLWLGHAGFDRMLGYGLKSTKGFAETHLGRIGKP